MGDKTSIEWTDATWNPVRGCSRVSPGCGGPNHQGGCYAEKIAARFSDQGHPFHGFAERTEHGGRWTGTLALVDELLDLPLRWKKPRRIFVNSMSDLFHENLKDHEIGAVFEVMRDANWHTFQVLTKRADRMREWVSSRNAKNWPMWIGKWLLPNVWLGVSVEDQARKDRIEELRRTSAAIRFLSLEPLLEDLGELKLGGISLAIIGGESGPNSRPFDLAWPRNIIRQCKAAGTACFMKQLGARPVETPLRSDHNYRRPLKLRDRKGSDSSEWPEDLRVREFPNAQG